MNFSDASNANIEDEVASTVPSEEPEQASDEVGSEVTETDGLNIDYDKSVEDIIADIENVNVANEEAIIAEHQEAAKQRKFNANNIIDVDGIGIVRKKKSFQPSKQHTGMKNLSFNVGAAVAPSGKMEFDQEEPESFGVVKINRPGGKSVDNTDNASTISSANSEGFTEQGYFDLKFHHNKLW